MDSGKMHSHLELLIGCKVVQVMGDPIFKSEQKWLKVYKGSPSWLFSFMTIEDIFQINNVVKYFYLYSYNNC